jgi:two-component system phosphate regulon response regulator PhoB
MKIILIVEDREDIAELIQLNLEKAGFRTLLASNGEKAIQHLEQNSIDLIVLDLMLPRISGLDLLKMIKNNKHWGTIPVIIESARSDEGDIVQGLELGADDYVTKPFSQKVLLARIQKIFERNKLEHTGIMNINEKELVVNRESLEVFLNEKPIALTYYEFKLLELLMLNDSKVMTREQILNEIWREEAIVVDRVIDVHITSLRKKLEEAARFIQTIRGVGYRFSSKKNSL